MGDSRGSTGPRALSEAGEEFCSTSPAVLKGGGDAGGVVGTKPSLVARDCGHFKVLKPGAAFPVSAARWFDLYQVMHFVF